MASRIPLERLVRLDCAIRAGEYPNAGTLGRDLEVDSRTIQRDIEFGRDRLKMPLVFDRHHQGYTYSDPDYRFPLVSLSAEELAALFVAKQVLSQCGTPFGRLLEEASAKLALGLPEAATAGPRRLGAAHSVRDGARPPCDAVLLGTLATAAAQGRTVHLRYWSFWRDEETERDIDPYHLALVEGRWYLVGHCHLRQETRVFVPARIRALELTERTFTVPAGFRLDTYLAHSLGILRGPEGTVHHVRLRFRGDAARYIGETVWHPSQTVEVEPNGALVVSFALSHLREVERWALSWLPHCEVIEPPELRGRIATVLAQSLSMYGAP